MNNRPITVKSNLKKSKSQSFVLFIQLNSLVIYYYVRLRFYIDLKKNKLGISYMHPNIRALIAISAFIFFKNLLEKILRHYNINN